MNRYDFKIQYLAGPRTRNITLTFFAKDQAAAEASCKRYLTDLKYDHWEIRKVTQKTT